LIQSYEQKTQNIIEKIPIGA